VHGLASTNWSFVLVFPTFINPESFRALLAEKLVTCTAKVPDIFEIEDCLTAAAFLGHGCLHNQLFRLWLCRKIQRCMQPCILHVDIHSNRQEALEHVQVTSSCGLVNRSVSILIDFECGHSGSQELADELVMTFVTGPVKGCILAHFACIFRFHKWVKEIVVVL
jgi:hypothetical protein